MSWSNAPAKINLGLWVGHREESGYHPVTSVMQRVGLSDRLRIEPATALNWESSEESLPMDANNLVVRAYAWYHQQIASLPLIRGRLEKRIPPGAGLGGGSSDAAALLRWAMAQTPTIDKKSVLAGAATLGVDVPFFLEEGAALVEGYGEKVAPFTSHWWGGVVLAGPGQWLGTPEVYAAFDALGGARSPGEFVSRIKRALEEGLCPLQEDLINDLEEAAFMVRPSLRGFRDRLKSYSDGAPLALSGSGPTYFLLGEDEAWALWMAQRLSQQQIPWVYPTTLLESW